MEPVSTIMSRRVVEIRSDWDLSAAIDTFLGASVRHLVVVDPDRQVLGVLSAEQLLAALGMSEQGMAGPVGDQVVVVPERVAPTDDIRRAIEVMLDEVVAALPVIEDGRAVGVLTWSDVVAHVSGVAS